MGAKKVLKKALVGLNIAFYTATATLTGMAAYSLLHHSPEQNLEYRLTTSDKKQMHHLGELVRENDPRDYGPWFFPTPPEAAALEMAFTSYSMVNIGLSTDDPEMKAYAVRTIEEAIEDYTSPVMLERILFNEDAEDALEDPNTGENLFYYSQLNMMLAGYHLLSDSKQYRDLHERITDDLVKNLRENGGRNLYSFPGMSWTADMPVALASLKVTESLYGGDYSEECAQEWKDWINEHGRDAKGNLYSVMDPETGKPRKEPKGSSFAYSIIFTHFFDPAFANDLYASFRKNFYTSLLGIDFAKEWEGGRSEMDLDSGPVIAGAGTVASAFAMGASKLSDDPYHFKSLSLSAELVTAPVHTFGGKQYVLNLDLGESVLLFCRTLRPWVSSDRP